RDWDAAVLTYGPYLGDAGEEIARLVAAFARDTGRTVVAHIHGLTGVTEALTDGEVRVPAFASGGDALDALAAMRSYGSRRAPEPQRAQPPGRPTRNRPAQRRCAHRRGTLPAPGGGTQTPHADSGEGSACLLWVGRPAGNHRRVGAGGGGRRGRNRLARRFENR